jgi:hypothetical protein
MDLSLQLAHLKRERASLEEEAGAARLDPAAAREKLLARVKVCWLIHMKFKNARGNAYTGMAAACRKTMLVSRP